MIKIARIKPPLFICPEHEVKRKGEMTRVNLTVLGYVIHVVVHFERFDPAIVEKVPLDK